MIYNYILEIKTRLLLILISWVINILICYSYKEILLYILIKLNKEIYLLNTFYFISTDLMDIFNVYIQLSYFFSNQLIIVVIIYHLLMFMSPGLFKHEFKILKDFLFFSYLFLFLSFLLFNSFILPKLWQFFFEFQNNKSVAVFFEAKVTHYVNFYIYTFYNLLIICQVFVCMFFFFKTINYKVNFLKKTKKLYYLLFVIFATLGSPPDVLSQLFLKLTK